MIATILIWKSDAVLVQVFTDKGIVGIGEGTPYGGPVEMKKFAEDYVKPLLTGQNPFDVELLAGALGLPAGRPRLGRRRLRPLGHHRQSKALPVFKLLATDSPPDPHIKLYASGGDEWAFYKHPENLIEEALRVKEQGYKAYKFRLGPDWKLQPGANLQNYIPAVEKTPRGGGAGVRPYAGIEHATDPGRMPRVGPVLEELRFLWFEEPVRTSGPDAIENHRKIRR